ncbi:hypothetical protein [Streptomyces lydicus]|uniref:hypothetical protein n=1 Tax=Streptomyces lydicus TaxID=47763 RepID=UPI0037130534
MSEMIFESFDASNRVDVRVYREISELGSKHTISCEVERGFWVVGGGATGSRNPGGLLTASFPRADRRAWTASSTDHVFPDNYKLTCYAIGISIAGFSPDELLKNHLRYDSSTGPKAAHPEASAQVPITEGFTLIGGGFQVNGPKNLATASYPEFDQEWTARSKDHGGYVAPTTITSWAISIRKKMIPEGTEGTTETVTVDVASAGLLSPLAEQMQSDVLLPRGYALTGAGAEVRYDEPGLLLWQIQPFKENLSPKRIRVSAGAKDHGDVAMGTLKTWAIGIAVSPPL